MSKLITVERAKREIERLQSYVNLVESYETDTLEKLIIKEYAFTNSISKIVECFKSEGITKDGKVIEHDDVLAVIKRKPTDDLHKLLKSGYMLKTRSSRRKINNYF